MTDNGELNLLHIDERGIVLSKAVQPNTCLSESLLVQGCLHKTMRMAQF